MSSSSHSHHHHTHETRSKKFWRAVLSFVLFLTLTAASLFACVRIAFVNPRGIEKVFTSEKYVAALCDDIRLYACDYSDRCAVPRTAAESTFTYGEIYAVEEAYIAGVIGTQEQFSSTTYIDYLDRLGKKFEAALKETGDSASIKTAKGVKEPEKQLSEAVMKYAKTKIELPYTDKLNTVLNVAKPASTAAAVIFAVLSLLLILIIPSVGTRMYRSLRSVTYAFDAAAVLEFLMVFGVFAVSRFKSLVLYPLYLRDTLLQYVKTCVGSVGVSAFCLFLLSIAVMSFTWKIRRNDKN